MSFEAGCCPLIPYTTKEKEEIWESLGLKKSIIEEDIDAISEWFERQPHLIGSGMINRDFIERMLVNAKGSREKTKKRIDNFYKYRAMAPELFEDRIEKIDDDDALFGRYLQATCFKLYQLKRVTVLKLYEPDPNKFNIEHVLRNSILLGDIRLKHDYTLGDIWIYDFTGLGLSHLLRINPVLLQKAANIFQEGVGLRIFGLHILGAPSFAQQLLQFARRFLKQKTLERVVFHNSVEDLYNYVPKEYLPKDYGGDQPSLEDFKDKYVKFLRNKEVKQFLRECNKHMSDEKKRPDRSFSDEYIQGSFKKLELD